MRVGIVGVGGKPVMATAEDGRRAAVVADALVESMMNGSRTIDVPY